MKKSMIWISGLVLSCGILFTACKKESSPSRSQMLPGTWTVNAYGQDDNTNGILDDNEHDQIPNGATLVLTFRSDNTGVSTLTTSGNAPVASNFAWQLVNNEQDLQVITAADNKITTAHISLFTNNELQGYDRAASPRVIIDLRK